MANSFTFEKDGKIYSYRIVRIHHLRAMETPVKKIIPYGVHWHYTNDYFDSERPEFVLSNTGGSTLVVIENWETGKRHVGLSLCRPNEHYNKKLGVKIAKEYAEIALVNDVNIHHYDRDFSVNSAEFEQLIFKHYGISPSEV